MAKLKVFTAQMGFFETVVAVPSKTAALEAWGAHQDLFATGMARKSQDAKACKAALAQPGAVLRRAVGSDGAFTTGGEVSELKLPKIKPAKLDKGEKPAKPRKAKQKPPSRSALTRAEQALIERQGRYAHDREAIEARRRALDEEADALRTAFDIDRTGLEKARAKASAAYRAAGG